MSTGVKIMEFIEIVLNLIKQKGISKNKMLTDLGLSKNSIVDWNNRGTIPNGETLSKIAAYFNISTDYLLNGTSNISQFPKSKSIKIPVLGFVRAGIPVEAVEDIIDYEEITQDMAEQGDFFALSVKGNSMEPRICEGDVVIVRKQSDIESGDLAIVLINGQDATVKKVMKNSHGITLVPFNLSYQPMMFSNREILELSVCIIGKVVELRGKFE
jgi:repressor LexA